VAAQPAPAKNKPGTKRAPAPSKPVAARSKNKTVRKPGAEPVESTPGEPADPAPASPALSFDEAKAAAIESLIESIELAEARLLVVKRAKSFEELHGGA
jgi:hypothetical protein